MKQNKKPLNILVAYNEPEHSNADSLDIISEAGVLDEARAVFQAVTELGHKPQYLAITDIKDCLTTVETQCPDLVVNLCEGLRGKASMEMHIAALWELLGIPYTGNTPLTLGLAQNKVMTKRLLESKRIHTPPYQVFFRIPKNVHISFPLIAKPACEDASLGITQDSVVTSSERLQQAVERILAKYGPPVLVEKFITGREFNISIIGSHTPEVTAISEIDFSAVDEGCPPITGYEAKWLKDHPMYKKTPPVCPAQLDSELKFRLEDTALQVYKLLGGRDYGRVDVRMDQNGGIHVLEFNPNPDISEDAGFARALEARGMKYVDFVDFLIQATLERSAYAKHTTHDGR